MGIMFKIKLFDGGKEPIYKTEEASGADCFARLEKSITVNPGDVQVIPLGFAIELIKGYEMQIRPRSGLSKKKIICILGTIDSDYRGEVCAIVQNCSEYPLVVNNGDRIVQAVIAPVIRGYFEVVDELSDSERGINGFGSTGIN